ncbi:MAG: metallophosphoesterase [Archangium sp.]|nr:metallophosphoesterase [Archangium sp.]
MKRSLVLPRAGQLLVSTDLHGNLRDWRALRAVFEASPPDTHWVVLGDLVHGPDEQTARLKPQLYGFEDQSAELIDELFELRERCADRVHFVLGNHDAGHVGFRHTAKFHTDEVEHLESKLTPRQHECAQQLFSNALLAVVAPCGVLMTHGSPGDALTSLALLDGPLPPGPGNEERIVAIGETLWCYGQRGEVSQRLLQRISAETALDLRVVVHGHDRDESGWFIEGGNQAQPVIFGAPDANKKYLCVDLAKHVESPEALEPSLRSLH